MVRIASHASREMRPSFGQTRPKSDETRPRLDGTRLRLDGTRASLVRIVEIQRERIARRL
jgi:hypothetical protein